MHGGCSGDQQPEPSEISQETEGESPPTLPAPACFTLESRGCEFHKIKTHRGGTKRETGLRARAKTVLVDLTQEQQRRTSPPPRLWPNAPFSLRSPRPPLPPPPPCFPQGPDRLHTCSVPYLLVSSSLYLQFPRGRRSPALLADASSIPRKTAGKRR